MVNCWLCKKPVKVTTEEHYYDEKLKKRYHMKCFAGICSVCDKPVFKKAKHKTVGTNVWHTDCFTRIPEIKAWEEFKKSRYEDALVYDLVTQERMDEETEDELADGLEGFTSQEGRYMFVQDTEHNREVLEDFGITYKRSGRTNPGGRKTRGGIVTIDKKSWKAMEAARKAAKVPKKKWREFESTYFKAHPPTFVEDRQNSEGGRKRSVSVGDAARQRLEEEHRKKHPIEGDEKRKNPSPTERYLATGSPRETILEENPLLVTPEQEMQLKDAYMRLKRGRGTEEDRHLVETARKTGVFMGTGPSIMFKKAAPIYKAQPRSNPKKAPYVIRDGVGIEFERGVADPAEAEARAIMLGRKHMREMTVHYE